MSTDPFMRVERPAPEIPSIPPEDYEIRISKRSSVRDVVLKLLRRHPDYINDSLEFLITTNGKVIISHVASHEQLQSGENVANCDVLSQGSMTLFKEGGKLRPVVRPKCCDLSGTDYFNTLIRRIEQHLLIIGTPHAKQIRDLRS